MTEVSERLHAVQEKVSSALAAAEQDDGASPVLVAVVREFAAKCDKALGSDQPREAVIELEQAGDSAKAAAEADPGAAEDTRTSVLDAHLAICILKSKIA